MADHIPFITGPEGGDLAKRVYSDSDVARIPLDRAQQFRNLLPAGAKLWIDPCLDGVHNLIKQRGSKKDRQPDGSWFDLMRGLPNFEKICRPAYHAKPDAAEVHSFVKEVMNRCAAHRPAWITVPQLPLIGDSARNKINHELAVATGRWKVSSGFAGQLILPLVFTSQNQVNLKTDRNRKVPQAERCYRLAQADGFWVVEITLNDEKGLSTLRKRFSGVIALHEELNARMPSRIRIAGPYWGLNLVLWARNLVDCAAIGIGSGYQYLLPGGPARASRNRLMLAPLRRRANYGPPLKNWLDEVAETLSPSHPAHAKFSPIRRQYAALSDESQARRQVAVNYKQWFDTIATVPKAGRSMALFQDLSAAFALGRSLPRLGPTEKAARRPDAVAEPLMLSCL